MDSNWNTAQGGAATGSSSGVGSDSNANLDWRLQLQPDARQRIVNKIMDTLKRHLPVPVPEGLNELQKIAVRSEEKIYSAATSQPDYLRKISLKMLSMETKAQPGLGPNIPNQNRVDPGGGMMSQQQPGSNPGQSLAMPTVINQAPVARQQQQQPPLQSSPNMPTALSGGPSGATIPPMSGPSISNSNPMTGPGGTSGPGGPIGSLSTDIYSNAQRRQQPQQLTLQNQMLYQQQQQLAIRHKLQQQQQQTQMQMSSALAGVSVMMSAAPTSGMQQSQLNSVQQPPAGQGGSFQQQALLRQQQQQPQATMQNPTIPMQQTNNVTYLQQQQLQMQQNQMQQNQMQQSQMQQNQMQQNQLQQNQIQQNQMLNQQMLLGRGGASNINMQRQMQVQRQAALLQQQQHLLFQLQPQQQQQLPQQQQASMMQQREMQMSQQRMLGSSALLETQNNNAIDSQRQQQQQFILQQQQPQQQQRMHQDVASSPASMDSTAQTVHPGDWQEELYQKLKYLKDTYFADLREIYQKLSIKLNQLDSMVLPNGKGGEQIEKMKHFKMVLERLMAVLSLGKHNLQIALKDRLPLYEKQILSILQTHKKVPQQQPPAGVPSDQAQFPPLQQSQPGMQSHQPPQQQPQQQLLPPQQMDNHTNQLQQQLSTNGLTQSNGLSMPNAVQQGMQNTLQSDQLLANRTGFGSLQQGSVGSTMQNTMNPPQMVGSGAAVGTSNMSHTVTMPGMQTNMSSAQVLKQHQQHQEQQIQSQQRMMPTPQQMQQRQFQLHLIRKQQLLQQQQEQQYPQQNQIQQLGQPSDSADLKSRQGAAGMKPGSVYQQQYPGLGPRNSYYHSQLKPGSNLPISSPQNIQSSSPQISQPSPKVDQGLIPPPQLKIGTPLQAAVSPFVPSPSPPVAPSPIIEDTKLGGLMHNSAALPTGQPLGPLPATSAQTSQMGQPQEGSLVGTPGLSFWVYLVSYISCMHLCDEH